MNVRQVIHTASRWAEMSRSGAMKRQGPGGQFYDLAPNQFFATKAAVDKRFAGLRPSSWFWMGVGTGCLYVVLKKCTSASR